ASSPIHAASSRRTGAPCAAKMTGIFDALPTTGSVDPLACMSMLLPLVRVHACSGSVASSAIAWRRSMTLSPGYLRRDGDESPPRVDGSADLVQTARPPP